MIRALFILLSITKMTSHDVYAHTGFSREELKEEALI